MIRPEYFIEKLRENGIDCFAGVPDSLLKNMCAYITDHFDAAHNIIAANEGAAVGLAAGHYLATGKPACVYMQNSGEGNIINPLASLTDQEVYNIPVLLLIGWRGRPGVHDEPQHVKQGKVTTGLLNVMGVNYEVLSKEEDKAAKQIEKAAKALANKEVFALVIEKDTFEDYKLVNNQSPITLNLSREEAIQTVAAALGEKDCIVSTTGMISRELFEYRAAIMHLGSMAIVANKAPKNYVHVVFNNGAHDSVGGQPTVGLKIDLPAIAKAVGYKATLSIDNKEDLVKQLSTLNAEGPILLEVKVKKGNRKDLGRPTTTPIQNKEALMAFLSK